MEFIEIIEKEIRNLIIMKSKKSYNIINDTIVCNICNNSSKISNFINLMFKLDITFCEYCKVKYITKNIIQDLHVNENEYLEHIKKYIISSDLKNIASTRRYMSNKRRFESEKQKYLKKWIGKTFSHGIYFAKQTKEKASDKKRVARLKIDLASLKNMIETPVNSSFDLYKKGVIRSLEITTSLLNIAQQNYIDNYKSKDPCDILSNFQVFNTILREKTPKCLSLDLRIDLIEHRISKEDYDNLLYETYLFMYNNEEIINIIRESILVVIHVLGYYCNTLDSIERMSFITYYRNLALIDLETIKHLII